MNFSPFTGHIPAAVPTIHQFAAKFGYEGGSGGIVQGQEVRGYHAAGGGVQYAQHGGGGGGLEPGKYRQPENVVVSINNVPNSVAVSLAGSGLAPINTVNAGVKYQTISATSSISSVGLASLSQQYAGQLAVPYSQHQAVQADSGAQDQHQHMLKTEQRTPGAGDKRDYQREAEMTQQDIMNSMMQQQANQQGLQQPQQLVVVLHEPKEAMKPIKQELRGDTRLTNQPTEFIGTMPASAWQSLTTAGGAVADYLSALPLGLHHLLKYSTEGKRDESVGNLITVNGLNANMTANAVSGVVVQTATLVNQAVNTTTCLTSSPSKNKKKKKKPPKEKKPRPKPGEIRLTTALDGSTLYCCPECHMAYPERGLLEQHLVGHTMERRFICDICNAALKRKDHLTRHKQSHNPERPYVCTVCLKAFKRKEQLTLHFVIHSGEKRHVCQECGKGFYRKDHLRKHTRSHIARRVKAELSQQAAASTGTLAHAVPAPTPAS